MGVGDKAMTSCRSALVASAAPLPLHVAATVAAHIYGKQIFISTAQAHPVHRVATVGGMWHAIIRQQSCKVCGAEREREGEGNKLKRRKGQSDSDCGKLNVNLNCALPPPSASISCLHALASS